MIATIANFLNYDLYDLELTTVKNNVELRRLLIDTSNKSIIVIKDIDCSFNHTSRREKKMRMNKRWIQLVKRQNKRKKIMRSFYRGF